MYLKLSFVLVSVNCYREPRMGGSYRCYECMEQFENDVLIKSDGGPCKPPVSGKTSKFSFKVFKSMIQE